MMMMMKPSLVPPNHPTNFMKRSTMEKFQELVFKLAEETSHHHPNTPLTPAAKSLIQDRLDRLISQYKTPDHPPYSAMIERALCELNEKGGSSEKSISQFLEKKYKDLPWAHLTLVKHHLGKLCESGDIILTRAEKYMFRGKDPTSVQSSSKRKPKRKVRWDWERDRNKRRKRKRNLLKGEKLKATENHWESDAQENGLSENRVGDEVDQAKWLKGEHAEDDNPSELPTTPERPPGFESVIEEEFRDSASKLEMLTSPLKMWDLASYPHDSIKQSEEMSIEKTSFYEHEKQQEEILVSDQIKSVDDMKSKKNNRAAFRENETLISENAQVNISDEPQQREHYSPRIEAPE